MEIKISGQYEGDAPHALIRITLKDEETAKTALNIIRAMGYGEHEAPVSSRFTMEIIRKQANIQQQSQLVLVNLRYEADSSGCRAGQQDNSELVRLDARGVAKAIKLALKGIAD